MCKSVDNKLIFRATWMIFGLFVALLIVMSFWFIKLESNTSSAGKGVLIGRPIGSFVAVFAFVSSLKWKIVFEKDSLIIGYPQDKIFYKSVKVNYSDITMVEIEDKRNINKEFSIIYITVNGYEKKFKITTALSCKKKQMREAFERLSSKVEARNQEKVGPSSSSV